MRLTAGPVLADNFLNLHRYLARYRSATIFESTILDGATAQVAEKPPRGRSGALSRDRAPSENSIESGILTLGVSVQGCHKGFKKRFSAAC